MGGNTDRQLLPEFFGQPLFLLQRRLVVNLLVLRCPTQGSAQLVRWEPLHPNQKATAMALAAGPALDERSKVLPAAEVEIADAETSVFSYFQGLL
jgi:hypothetical protein